MDLSLYICGSFIRLWESFFYFSWSCLCNYMMQNFYHWLRYFFDTSSVLPINYDQTDNLYFQGNGKSHNILLAIH